MGKYFSTTKNFWMFLIALVFSATLFGCTVVHYCAPQRVQYYGTLHLHHIPGSYVYVVADMDDNIFFYDGRWYRHYDNFWYHSAYYSGSWIKISIGTVPVRLHKMPGTYRKRIKRDAYRIPHHDLERNYKRWEKNRHWDNGRKHDYERGRRRHDSQIREHDRDGRYDRDGRRDSVDGDSEPGIARPEIIIEDKKSVDKSKKKKSKKKKSKKKKSKKKSSEDDEEYSDNGEDNDDKKGRGRY